MPLAALVVSLLTNPAAAETVDGAENLKPVDVSNAPPVPTPVEEPATAPVNASLPVVGDPVPEPIAPAALAEPARTPTATFPSITDAQPPNPPQSTKPTAASNVSQPRANPPVRRITPGTTEPRPLPSADAPFDESTVRNTSEPPTGKTEDESSDDIIRLGPVVGVGLPGLLSIGGLLKLTSYLGGGVNVGLIPSTRISYYGEAKLSYQEYDVYGRLFPFGGGFFLGAGVGYATIKGSLKSSYDTSGYLGTLPSGLAIPNPLTYESQGSVKTMVLTPQIGYFYTTGFGFSLGLDLGAQVPIAPSKISYNSQLSLPANTPQPIQDAIQTQYIDPNDKKVYDTLHAIGRTILPTFNLRVGWLF